MRTLRNFINEFFRFGRWLSKAEREARRNIAARAANWDRRARRPVITPELVNRERLRRAALRRTALGALAA